MAGQRGGAINEGFGLFTIFILCSGTILWGLTGQNFGVGKGVIYFGTIARGTYVYGAGSLYNGGIILRFGGNQLFALWGRVVDGFATYGATTSGYRIFASFFITWGMVGHFGNVFGTLGARLFNNDAYHGSGFINFGYFSVLGFNIGFGVGVGLYSFTSMPDGWVTILFLGKQYNYNGGRATGLAHLFVGYCLVTTFYWRSDNFRATSATTSGNGVLGLFYKLCIMFYQLRYFKVWYATYGSRYITWVLYVYITLVQ